LSVEMLSTCTGKL